MNKIEVFDDVFRRHKIDLKKPVFSIPIVIEMMDDAIESYSPSRYREALEKIRADIKKYGLDEQFGLEENDYITQALNSGEEANKEEK